MSRSTNTAPPQWRPTLLTRLVRSRIGYWAIAALLALGAAVVVGRAADRADAARDSYGRTITVAVMTEPVSAGEPIGNAARLVALPEAVVPAGAMDAVPADAVAATNLFPEEILLEARLRGGHRLPPATLAFAINRTLGIPPVTTGDAVALVTVADPFSDPSLRTEGPPVAGVVVETTDEIVLIAVAESDAPAVAAAIAANTIVVAAA